MEIGGIIVLSVGASGLIFFFLLMKSMLKKKDATTILSKGFSWSWRGDGKK